jgi:Flp pilus assembly protein TadG
MVETALVLLTLLWMVMFIFDMGMLLLKEQAIAERARTTARMAAVNNWSQTQVQNHLVYNRTSVPDGVSAGSPGILGLLPSQVAYSTVGTVGQPDHQVVVTVQNVTQPLMIPVWNGPYTLPAISVAMPAQSLGATN